jgi:peptide/nickel transport system permease protein
MKRLFYRLAMMVPILFAIATVSFVATRIGGADPAVLIAPPESDNQTLDNIRARLGTDKPVFEQYVLYIGDVARLDLGTSYFTEKPVLRELLSRAPATFELMILGMFIAVPLGVVSGAIAARKRGSIRDRTVRGSSFALLALPEFWIGLLLIYVFFFRLRWAPPPIGQIGVSDPHPTPHTNAVVVDALISFDWTALRAAARYAILPVITVGLAMAAPIARLMRSSMIEVLGSDYVRFAEACGLSKRTLFRYTSRAALAPVVTFVGILFSVMLGSSVLTEVVFSWGGASQFVAESALRADLPMIQGFVVAAGVFSVVVFFIVDAVLQLIDPRVRLDY